MRVQSYVSTVVTKKKISDRNKKNNSTRKVLKVYKKSFNKLFSKVVMQLKKSKNVIFFLL